MKRRILIVFMGLMLLVTCCACNSNGESDYGKYADLINKLEAGDYQGAHDAIDAMNPNHKGEDGPANEENNQPISTPTNTPNNDNEEKPALLQKLCGNWEALKKDITPDKMVFQEDGTCTIDGTAATWTVKHSSATQLSIELSNGMSASLSESDGDYTMRLLVKGSLLSNYADYFKPADYEIVTITKDNWNTYFELFDQVHFNKNALGDYATHYHRFEYRLKQEYYDRLAFKSQHGYSTNSKTQIAAEFTYTITEQPIIWDKEAWTYTKDGAATVEDERSYVSYLSHTNNSISIIVFNYNYSNWASVLNIPVDVQVSRVEGMLYLRKEG